MSPLIAIKRGWNAIWEPRSKYTFDFRIWWSDDLSIPLDSSDIEPFSLPVPVNCISLGTQKTVSCRAIFNAFRRHLPPAEQDMYCRIKTSNGWDTLICLPRKAHSSMGPSKHELAVLDDVVALGVFPAPNFVLPSLPTVTAERTLHANTRSTDSSDIATM